MNRWQWLSAALGFISQLFRRNRLPSDVCNVGTESVSASKTARRRMAKKGEKRG